MKQTILLSLFLLLVTQALQAQYGNEWIDYSKTYYKFTVSKDGIHRIPQSVLAAAGLSSIPGSQFRLMHDGSEVPIYTTTDGLFTPGDFIEFYGEQNRGDFDRALFQDPDDQQLNPGYSMFTDASAYFLTWDDAGSGLRIEQINNDLTNPPAAETYYVHKTEWVYSDQSLDPRNASAETFISYSRYQEAEGFASGPTSAFSLDVPSSMISAAGPDAHLSVRMASSSLTIHNITALFDGDTLLNQANASGFRLYQLDHSIPAGNVTSSQTLTIQDSIQNGTFSIASVEWTYSRQFDFTGISHITFNHNANGSPQYFVMNSFSHGGSDPVIYDRTNNQRLIGNRNGTTTRFVLPAFSGERQILVASQADEVFEVEELTARTFVNYENDHAEYLIITHPDLRTGDDVVGEYADYRSSAAGGNYNVKIYSILDLYDQFGYGIEKHPQAIRNFHKMILDHWDAPKMVLIIGKGIVYTVSRVEGSEAEQHILVPTFGNPGADNLFFTENGISLPPFPVGRLPVANAGQLKAYLNKIIEYDQVKYLPQTVADKGWTKHILHLGGGADASQQGQILALLDQMASNAINSPLGAYVTTYSKSSTNNTSESNSDLIIDILQEGTQLVKFFGHSSASRLDFQVNNPADWNNKGKYPIFSAMGCRSGDIFQDFLSLSENFVFEPDAGVIAFIAGSGSQYLNILGSWGIEWYDVFGNGFNDMTLGETVLESLASLNQFGGVSSVIMVEQQTITGDPAIRFYGADGPDYVWDFASVRHTPEVLATNENSFILQADVLNIGANIPDTVQVTVRQKLPDGSETDVISESIALYGYRNTLDFEIPIERSHAGLNTYYLTIDALQQVDELPAPAAEDNNELADDFGKEGYEIFILDNRARATYPPEFSIVTDQQPDLIASSTNAFIKGQRMIMEIDTTALFNSPLKTREYFDQFGSTIKWRPLIQYTPGTVYYWRVSTDSISALHGYTWDVSSFLFNPGGQRGWNQSHYYQFLRNDFDDMEIDQQRNFRFENGIKNVWVQNAVNTGPIETFAFYVDNTNNPIFYRDWDNTTANVFVAVFDTTTGKTVKNPAGGAYGAINPFGQQRPVFPFNTDNAQSRNDLMTFLTDIIPSGYYAVLYTYQREGNLDYYPEQWAADSIQFGRNLFSVIESIYPESQIRTLQNGAVPYTFMFQKDRKALAEQVALNFDATINADFNIPVPKTSGAVISRTIGPASKWTKMEWDFSGIDAPADDEISVSISGLIPATSDTVLLIDKTVAADVDLSFIDAREYPFLYLQLYAKDSSDLRTSPQLDFWRVLFDGKPEFVYVTTPLFVFEYDSLNLGDSLHFMTSIQNVSSYPSDEMQVRYTIRNRLNQTTEYLHVMPPLEPGEMTTLEYHEPVQDTDGDHTFLAEINSDGLAYSEVHHFNNFGIRQFYVIPDRVDPQLDVTFDGRHLLDGDVVAKQPQIIIALRDGNSRIPVLDREMFEVFLERPGAFEFEKIDLFGSDVAFIPSNPGAGIDVATIVWQPTFEIDGIYTLRVYARDAQGNHAQASYEITFEVIGDTYLLDLTVFPNPFFESTRFTFVLTGHAAPSKFVLRITDLTGRVVREWDSAELGNVYVGTHHADIIWDGTNGSGSQVPSGMYFYTIEAVTADGIPYKFDRFNGEVGKILLQR